MAIFYHGSSVLFDSFSLSHALEGDGKGKFGWGVYVTEKYATAAHYAFNKHRPDNDTYYVYTVEIPDRTPDNCLSLMKGVPVAASYAAVEAVVFAVVSELDNAPYIDLFAEDGLRLLPCEGGGIFKLFVGKAADERGKLCFFRQLAV